MIGLVCWKNLKERSYKLINYNRNKKKVEKKEKSKGMFFVVRVVCY